MVEASRFLSARWVHLAMANYEVDPACLAGLVPRGTTLDLWEGHCLASIVSFQFLDTRVLGVPVPFHRDFDEVNLRFYVRRQSGYSWDGRVTSIQGRRIAIMHGWAYGARFDSLKPYLDLHVAPSVELAFKLLMAERVDLVASNERDSRPRIAELGLEGDVSPLEPVIDTQVGYFALPRGESQRPLREDIERDPLKGLIVDRGPRFERTEELGGVGAT